ncbi:MAG: Hsp20/alpha crystallin family protein [Sulfurimonas sp.]
MFKKKITFLLVPILSALTLHAAEPFMNDPFGDDIFKEMLEMQKEMDKVFERMHQRMQERTKQLNQPNVQFYMPGAIGTKGEMFVDKGACYEYDTGVEANKENEINLSVRDNILTFKAKVTKQSSEAKQGMQSQQSYTSVLQRSRTLPRDADASTVKMQEKEGKIVVTIRKKKENQKSVVTPKAERKSSLPSKKTEKKAADPTKPSL